MKNGMFSFLLFFTTILFSCEEHSTEQVMDKEEQNNESAIQAVNVSGNENAYSFSVTIASPDTGCDQYADWWEVISEDGKMLIYRRILAHSHVDEQPFTRSGGQVKITRNQIVTVRMHMNNSGYSPNAMKGSVESGWKSITLATDFATSLANEDPLPNGCAF